jgi:hypothetical protein
VRSQSVEKVTGAAARAGRNTRGSLARSARSLLGSARLGSDRLNFYTS